MPNPDDLERLGKEMQEILNTTWAPHNKAELEQRLEEINLKLEAATQKKSILCLDFDGVIHSYTSGWKGIDVIPDPPVDGAIEFFWTAVEHFSVCIYSTRNEKPEGIKAMREWLAKQDEDYWLGKSVRPRTSLTLCIDFPTTKPPAFVGIDDRVITFNGTFPDMETLKNFKPWNKK